MVTHIDLKSELKNYFGFDTFKGNQEEIILSLLAGNDVFVLMPTGGGKSLCYQLPSLMLDGTAIIISPLIALMKNQVDAMRNFGEDDGIAHFLNSSLNKSAIEKVKSDILSGKTKLLYVAPESLTKEEIIDFLRGIKISFYAVDEAHCISEWGHDFRPEYRRIRPIINEIGVRPVIALTATATPKVQHDIQKNLGMQNAKVFKSSFNRPNLYYEVRSKTKNVDKDIIKYIKSQEGKSGIIYCLSRKKVEELAEMLSVNNIKALPYHAGMDSAQRNANQDAFLLEKVDVIVATIAFGMGIDKSNVRMTFHLNYPGSLESFVQEAGRAGRDKKMALATIMYSPKKFWVKNVKTDKWQDFSADYTNNKFFYDSNFLGEEFELFVMELLMNNLQVKISNEEFYDVDKPCIANSQGIVKFIKRYEKGHILTYYISYEEDEKVLDGYNQYLSTKNMPVFNTYNARNLKNSRGYSYIRDYGSAVYKDAIQKAIYRMCVIGLIDDFTEDYSKRTFRITTICQDESEYLEHLRLYYRKYYSTERVESMMGEVRKLANTEGVIMACLKHLTSFIYKSIADKRARGILDMEQFCNMAISSKKDWKETNEELKDFIYYYFNSKYAREGFVTYDSNLQQDVPFSLKDDTSHDIYSEDKITSFELVRKYMRVVDAEIVNNDSQMDNIKHLQGAVRLIRRAIAEMNPVLNLLNVFCILYLGQEANEMLEDELYNDYKAVYEQYMDEGKSALIDEFTQLLIKHAALKDKEYINKIQLAIQLEEHVKAFSNIKNKYAEK